MTAARGAPGVFSDPRTMAVGSSAERAPSVASTAAPQSGAFEAALRRPLPWPGPKPVLAVVVDTEEEFDWRAPFSRDSTSVRNIAAQPALQRQVYDPRGVVPMHAVDWPVVDDDDAVAALLPLLREGRCEIGAHQQPWVCPPHDETVDAFHSYHGNLPPALEHAKIERLTDRIEQRFGQRPVFFKAGRYGLGPRSLALLLDQGYRIDGSVASHASFRADGGPDWSGFDAGCFAATPRSSPNGPALVELPVTAGFMGAMRRLGPGVAARLYSPRGVRLRLPGIAARLGLLERARLSPEGHTLDEMKRLTRALRDAGHGCFSLTYHSPSLIVGGTPYVRDEAERAAFVQRIEGFLDFFAGEIGGVFMPVTTIARTLMQGARAGS